MNKKTSIKKRLRPAKAGKPSRKDPNVYPKGWNRQRVQAVIAHYENQTEDEAMAEDEAAFRDGAFAMIQVPIKLVPAVQKLLAKRAG
jgi:hypothetical protein